MDKDMEVKVLSQLSLNVGILFCKHSNDKVCSDCLENISGRVSDIKKLLEEKKKAGKNV